MPVMAGMCPTCPFREEHVGQTETANMVKHMIEDHRIKNGLNYWNKVPKGCRQLKPGESVQSGDVMKLNDEWFGEYKKGILIGQIVDTVSKWYRFKTKEVK